MVVSLKYELVTFSASIILALFVGVQYDFFRSLRSCTKITVVWDVLMWISVFFSACGVWFFVMNGEVRWYVVVGSVLTGVIYILAISKYVFLVFRFLVDKICRVFRIFFKILLTPLAFLCKMICVYGTRARLKFSKKVEEKYYEKNA